MVDTRDWTTDPAAIARDLFHDWLVGLGGTDTAGTEFFVTFDRSQGSSEAGWGGTLVEARVTHDLTRAPGTTVELTVADIDEAFVDRIDPRRDLYLIVKAGYRSSWGDDDVHEIAYAKVTSLRRDETGRAVIKADSHEVLILDNADLESTYSATLAAAELVSSLAATCGAQIDRGGLTGPATTLRVDNAWDGIQDVCNAQGWRVHAGPMYLELRPIPTGTEPARADLTTGPDGTIISRELEASRTPYANRVRLNYTWRDANNVEQSVRGIASSATYDVAGNRKTSTFDRAVSTTQARANTAAAAILARMTQRGRVYRVSALAHYWLQVGDVVTIARPEDGSPERALVESLTFSTDGSMDLTTRSTA